MLMVLVPSAAFARVAYLCKLDGTVRSACCCPSAKASAEPSTTAMREACCCDVSEMAPSTAAAADAPKPSALAQPAFVAIADTIVAAMARRIAVAVPPRALASRHRAHLAHLDRSLFASHCSFLL
jgi:hypothetical protein